MPYAAKVPRFLGQGKITFTDHEYADPGVGELLLRVQANAICGSDRGQYFGGSSVIPGHEAAGTVFAAGPDATLPEGTRGVVYLMGFCGMCRSCLIGATNQCLAKRADMGFTADGGFGPYELVQESAFFPVPDEIDIGNATLLLDVMGTSGHALSRAELVRPDIESVYIAGAGPIGLGLLVMTKLRYGADFPVFVSDISSWRLDFAESLGATPVLATEQSAVGLPREVDVAFDSSGKESARRTALDLVSQRGVLVCVGHGEGLSLNVSDDLLAPERAIMGSEYFRFDELAENLLLLQRHQEAIARIVSHRIPVAEIGDAFELFLSGQTGKVLITQEA